MAFANTHLSFSRLSRFEQCPLSFRLHYVDRKRSEPGMPLRFGKVVHAALERLLFEVVDEEHVGTLDPDRAVELFRGEWIADGLTGAEEFAEGVAMVRRFAEGSGTVDHRDVLAIEKEFRVPAGRFTVLGYIDRIDRIDDETIEIIDYKTNRQLFTREEVDQSLQLSLYELAARRLWPWVKKVRLTFAMLRHGVRMTTTRTREQLDAALAYIEALGEATETATEYPARVGSHCLYCDHRASCSAYTAALESRPELGALPSELEAVAREREEVAKRARLLYARKVELEEILRAHLRENDDLILAGVCYSLVPTTTGTTYPTDKTLDVVAEKTGLGRDELVSQLTVIDKAALDALVRDIASGDRARGNLLRAELDALAERTISPRFSAKEVRS
jgi:RecB family exonuclease